MLPNTEIEVPLFLHVIEPIGIIILNNEVLDYDYLGANKLHPNKVLDLLSIMYNDRNLRDVLPSEFYPMFAKRDISVTEKCLTGIDDFPSPYVFMCLRFEIEISKDRKIQLHNLTYNRKDLHLSINLSAINLFFILANLCVEYVAIQNCTLKEIEKSEYNKKDVVIPTSVNTIYNFAFNYLQFVGKALKNSEIQPEYILLSGGVHTLMFLREIKSVSKYFEEIIKQVETKIDHLSQNEKYIYFTLLRCFEEEDTNTPMEVQNRDIGSSKYEKEIGIDTARKILIHAENLEKNRPGYFIALQKLQRNLRLDSY